ncbi:serine/arginine repetitive matrix protein 1-like [Drosophila serrata]|uniref:serine/arginine repetitive matrix protein 1-like n=1 Tax=Drosophila serrata TaxID=7274 RepID=UPI000A1CF760|nr:serine/arginine repetitive matrix protein 1-like [Drosophila serrata]
MTRGTAGTALFRRVPARGHRLRAAQCRRQSPEPRTVPWTPPPRRLVPPPEPRATVVSRVPPTRHRPCRQCPARTIRRARDPTQSPVPPPQHRPVPPRTGPWTPPPRPPVPPPEPRATYRSVDTASAPLSAAARAQSHRSVASATDSAPPVPPLQRRPS